jgi:hypothetical protein
MPDEPKVQPTITSKNLNTTPTPPKPPVATPEVEIPYEQIEAKPLRAPNMTSLKPKNPNISLYWGNRAVGEKESTLRYDQLIAMGFVPAKPDDVWMMAGTDKLPCPQSLQRDGRVLYGDLILLKIGRAEYIGAQKWNEQSARLRVKRPGVAMNTGASQDIKDASSMRVDKDDSRKAPAPAGFPHKVSPYVPQIAEVDAKTADNSGPETDFNLASKS